MCDYSLQHVANRPAKVGDKLVTSTFVKSITRGFAALGEPGVAVCLLPGTELVFDREAEYESEKMARFRQINLDSPHEHHDALEFSSGRVVLLTRLSGGQRATVMPVRRPSKARRTAKPRSSAQHFVQ